MTPLAVRARIEALLLSSAPTDPSAAALLSRIPRPLCGSPSCAALGGRLSRKTGKCGRCGSTKAADRHVNRSSDGTIDRDRPSALIVQPGSTVVTAQRFVVEKMPTKIANAALLRSVRSAEKPTSTLPEVP